MVHFPRRPHVRSGRARLLRRRFRRREGTPVMRAVVQRVRSASVSVSGRQVARIGTGLLALVAIHRDDTAADLEWMARKIVELRIFEDTKGKMNLGLAEAGGEL